ncbi:NAD(P)/FAD-dependent oxidoreductase [Bradyrhizobium genosp. L]|uniref:flavin-containing monooxygenase n=1 Tax=Bradyrhizobium genosp. L TaxID=83637 RepID=UPI0018A2B25A|nr:NAD(P)/FAD-dependent oxidoreductase [Bradyrhizobium genosp. L]QPF85425.1 NAD(P)/FAD-dependent oxidoreductase [Bradyrhizobium genosp. L]
MSTHFDVLIVGAGLSGIGAGYHLQTNCPDRSYAILEGRDCIGGTWDLFRYPGIRSDSDMYTLGYSFRPWTEPKAIADGPSILNYVRETARAYGIDQKIRFNHRVVRADWSSADAQWTVEVERGAEKTIERFTCNFLFMCSGYYKYEHGYTPDFPGLADFAGRVVHPQQWTDDIDYAGKKVVVIGSGATAVTLVPEMAKTADHVTMLQRSPTYVVARPDTDKVADWLRARLPAKLAYGITRWKNVGFGMFFYRLCKKNPERVKRLIRRGVRHALGDDYDIATHFTPRYNPWDQRLCLVPNGDLFTSIKSGKSTVVTDQIETFTKHGIKLKSGDTLDADVVVTATGLDLQVLGGLAISVDGASVDLSKSMNYKGLMCSGVPNLAAAFGYTNASWTLKCDLTCEYVCRLLNYMKAKGYAQVTPRRNDPTVTEMPWVDFSSGYIQRAVDRFPKQGSRRPWRLYQNYALDLITLRFGSLTDEALEYLPPRRAATVGSAAGPARQVA